MRIERLSPRRARIRNQDINPPRRLLRQLLYETLDLGRLGEVGRDGADGCVGIESLEGFDGSGADVGFAGGDDDGRASGEEEAGCGVETEAAGTAGYDGGFAFEGEEGREIFDFRHCAVWCGLGIGECSGEVLKGEDVAVGDT